MLTLEISYRSKTKLQTEKNAISTSDRCFILKALAQKYIFFSQHRQEEIVEAIEIHQTHCPTCALVKSLRDRAV